MYFLEEPEKEDTLVKIHDDEDEKETVMKKGLKAICGECGNVKEPLGTIKDSVVRYVPSFLSLLQTHV